MSRELEPAGAQERTRQIIRVLWLTLALNWGVALIKVIIGILSERTTVVADGFHSLLDGANNLVAIVAIRLAARPPDAEHPYGHRKFENLAAMAIGGLVMLLAWETLKQVIAQFYAGFRSDQTPDAAASPGTVDWLFVGAIAGSLLVNFGVSTYERRVGRRLNSPLLTADAAHTRSDATVTAMGLFSLLTGGLAWWIDPLLATGVVVFLLRAAWDILNDSLLALTDRQRLDPESVRDVVERVEGVLNAHAIRSHGPANDIHLDLHIVVGETLTARETAEIEGRVKLALQKAFPEVTHIAIEHQTHSHDEDRPLWHD